MPLIEGGLLIVAGVLLEPFTGGLSTLLIQAGIGMVIAGIGTALSNGPLTGTTTASRNPTAPWNVIYGKAKLGGIMVFVDEWNDDNKYLDMVLVLASHPCASVDALLFDGQRIPLDANGCSFTPVQHTVDFVSLTRSNGVVIAVLTVPVPFLQTGDSLLVENVWDHSFNGKYAVTVVDSLTFTYVCGGYDTTITSSGRVQTLWPDYKAKVHMEVLLGDHTDTFPGMLNGTPYDGDPGNLVVRDSNPWTYAHRLLGKTSVFLRLHYNDTIFANGLPTISFHVSGKGDIYDPRLGPLTPVVQPNVIARPTTTLNGWGANGHVGGYELGDDQATHWGVDPGTTAPYANPDTAVDGDITSAAQFLFQHGHQYGACIWSFATRAAQTLWLNVRSEVPPTSTAAVVTQRSAGIWYTLDGGTTWAVLYDSNSHRLAWDNVPLSPTQDMGLVQVMAFADSHDDMVHNVYDVNVADGPFINTVQNPADGYTTNAALCIADYLSNTTWGFKAIYGTEIPLPQLIAAANICDEQVPLAAGGTESRYTLNGNFPLTMMRSEVLQNLLTSCGGRLTYSGGQFVIWPAAWPGSTSILSVGNKGNGVATLKIVSTHINGFGDAPVTTLSGGTTTGAGSANVSTDPNVLNHDAWLVRDDATRFDYSDSWNSRTDSVPLPSAAPNYLAGLKLWFRNWDSLSGDIKGFFSNLTGECSFILWDMWIEVVYPDGSMDKWLPADLVPLNFPPRPGINFVGGTESALCCANGKLEPIDDGIFYLMRDAFRSLADFEICTLRVDGFKPAASTTGPPALPIQKSDSNALAIAAGPFRWREKVSIRDLYNGVKGTYISPTNSWQSSDIPRYAQDQDHGYFSGSPLYPLGDANLAADGGERRWLDIQLPFTISIATAQRLCKIELMRRRQQGTGTFSYNMAMYKVTTLDIVAMTLPLLGWTGKLLEVLANRFTIDKQSVDGNDVVLLGTELDVQATDPSIYDWSTTEELTAQGTQQGTSTGSGTTSTLVSFATYINAPAIALSQPDATHIALAAVTVAFPSSTATYTARSIVIADPGGVPTWYYVTIADPDFFGDVAGSALIAFAETSTAKVGVTGFIYMGAIQVTHAGGTSATPLPGGWPAPQSFLIGT